MVAHPTLFTRIELGSDGEPVQTIDDTEVSEFKVQVSICADIEAEKDKFVKPFKIVGDRLFRLQLLKDNEHYYLLQDIHHIISDGASRMVMLADIEKAYRGEQLQPEEKTMAEVATAEDARSKSADFEADKKWYADHFDCGDVYSPLLGDILAEGKKTSGEAKLSRQMMVDVDELEAYCKNHGIYKSTFFTAAYGYLLAKYNNEQQALFSTIHNGRSDKQLAHSVAMLVRTLPVYAKWDDETTVLDFLNACQEQMSGCRQHETYSYSDVVNDLGLQSATMFAWHGSLFDSLTFARLPMQAKRLNNNSLEVAIYVKAYIRDGKYIAEAEYNPGEYSDALVAQFLESYEAVVQDMLKQSMLRNVEITTPEQKACLDGFNTQGYDYDTSETIVSLFRKQAKATPDAMAVVFKDHRYTYAQVDEISDRMACYIASKGIGREDAVSVLINRSEWMAIASLGILKAGCAYQPLDPTYPKERLNFMVKDANARLLIADEDLCDVLDEYDGDVLLTKDIAQLPEAKELPEGPRPENLFILLYTSGSTGVPKGCQLTHANLVCYCHWYWRYYDLKPEHNVAEYASYGFDVHQEGIYPPLTGGATVHIIPEELRLDLMALNEYFEREHITHTFITTQVGYQFATNIENHSLLHLSVAGEKLAPLTPPKGYKMHNGYGPTEATILVTVFEVNQKYTDIPIGKPLDNVRTYVTDAYGHRIPVGALGELWLSGPQVARGYLNRPEKQAEVFITNPFTDEKKWTPVYRTGDIVRYLPDGNIQFIGRRDGQVKIRGFRIELKEVEAIIREFPGIKDATVQAFDDEGGGKFIAAYVVSDQKVDIEALNNFIIEEKPPYMVPAVTMQIDAIPLNQNQKVNKKALPVPEKKAVVVEESNVPMNVLEQELHEMISIILKNNDFGVTTVLGYAGLTSISAIKLAVQVQKRYNVALDAKSLVKTGTLQGIENEILKHVLTEGSSNNGGLAAEVVSTSPDAQPNSTFPLSYAQTGVYFDCLKNPSTTLYNIPYCIGFAQGTDTQALANALKELIKRHPQLTVHFGNDGTDIVQTVDLEQAVEIPQKQMSEEQL